MTYHGLTNLGEQYMAKCLANQTPVKFTKVKVGNGILEEHENPAAFTDIKSIKKEVQMADKKQVDDAFQFLVVIDNDGVNEGFYPRELGIYVDDNGVEKLYWYINDGNECQWLPPTSKGPTKHRFWETIMVTTLESVIVNWSGKELWIDQQWMNDNTTTVEEIRNIFSQKQFIYDTLELATEADIRNLFTGTRMEGKAQFDLSSLSENEATIVNMRLLSLFNDLLQQRMNADGKNLQKTLTDLINTTKNNLQSAINLKANTSDVNLIKKNLEDAINLRATIEFVNSMKNELNTSINKKANQVITVTGGGALTGGGDLSTNRVISHKDAAGFKHIPAGGAINQFLKWSALGTASWVDLTLANLGIEVTSIPEIQNNFKK
jgi:hypothetical protein|nr:MAG TPA: tail-collar fiber protein [Caudoviricetes sp.]